MKTLLVTGGSSDIALCLIEKIASDYDKIIAHYNSSKDKLEQLKAKIGDKLILLKADFRDTVSTEEFIEKIEKIAVPNHIIHFPASRLNPQRFDKSSWDELADDIMIQLHSIYRISQKFIKQMSKTENSKIIFILSSAVIDQPKFNTNYIIAKYSLWGLLKSLSKEYEDKVQVNAVSPILTETKFLENLPDFVIEQAAQSSPIKRNLKPNDVAEILSEVLSDNFCKTGQNILIDRN